MGKKSVFIPLWNKGIVHKMFADVGVRAEYLILDMLIRTGEEFEKTARQNGDYQNWTGNLRSSIGYAVLKDGKIIKESAFEKVQGSGANSAIVGFTTKEGRTVNFHAKGKSGDGSEGQRIGRELIHELASTYNKGYVLLCVAGMRYAMFVEAIGNRDVITRSAYHAIDFIKTQSKILLKDINKR